MGVITIESVQIVWRLDRVVIENQQEIDRGGGERASIIGFTRKQWEAISKKVDI